MRDRSNRKTSWRRALSAAIVLGLAGVALTWSAPVRAQDYPSRTVKMIVPYPAGGITDVLPRVMQEWLTKKWGQPIVIDNRPGIAGNIGAEAVFKSDPDGYTLMVTAPSPLTVNQSLYPKLAFEPAEFVPVSILATIPSGLFVNPKKVPANTLAEFIAHARANPGKITAATQGIGTTSHLTSEWFQLETKVKFVQVPYRGSAPALQGLVAGDVDIMFDNLGVSLQLAKSGQLKLLAVGSDKRMTSLADVPALAEALPGFSSSTWVGVFLPPKTPQKIADQLSGNFADALKVPEIAAKFREHACEPVGGAPAATAAFVKAEAERWRNVIKTAGIKLE
jgi:tripartite-type tricarboxylate transporter receptor subunit TctC